MSLIHWSSMSDMRMCYWSRCWEVGTFCWVSNSVLEVGMPWCMMQIIATVHVVELEYLHRNHPHFRSAQYLNSTLPFHNAFATFYCCPCPSQKILHSRHGVSALSDFHCQSLLAADSQEHQLSSYHFIFSRFWKNECIHCSILLNVILAHIAQ